MADALLTGSFAIHITSGFIAMVAGLLALCATKGGRLHRRAGSAFMILMVIMAVFAAVLGAVQPGQIINVFIAGFTLYLVTTAWLAVRHGDGTAGPAERLCLAVSTVLCLPFALVIFQIVSGVTLFKTAFAIEGAILIALCTFAAIIALAALGDLRVVMRGGISGTARIARHLWRVCFAFTLSLGSAFTNGFARLLPGPYHVPPAFFLTQLLMLVVLVYWLVRVRFPGWDGSPAPNPEALIRAGGTPSNPPSAWSNRR